MDRNGNLSFFFLFLSLPTLVDIGRFVLGWGLLTELLEGRCAASMLTIVRYVGVYAQVFDGRCQPWALKVLHNLPRSERVGKC